jgi:hypothetical protein
MPVTITSAATSPVLNVLGEELRPLTPAAELTSPPDMDAARALAARHDVEAMADAARPRTSH